MEKCYIEYAMKSIGGKWKLLIIWTVLKNKVIRFNDLQRKIDGISSLMLSKCLKELEVDGLVIRHQYNEIPPKVEYELSELSQKLVVVMQSLNEWGCEAESYKNNLNKNNK